MRRLLLSALLILAGCAHEKRFVQSTNDEFGPRPDLERVYAELEEPKSIHWIEAEDHFFKGALVQLEDSIAGAF